MTVDRPAIPRNYIKPLSLTSDQHQFSPNNINRQSRGRVMRINKIITEEKKALIFYQILSTHFLRKYIEISLENLYVDIGANKGLNDKGR